MFDLMPHRKRFGKEVVSFKDEMDNLFNRFFDMDFTVSRRLFKDGEWAPRVDVIEGKAEIPGCDANDLDVKLDGRILKISGEKKQENEEKCTRQFPYYNGKRHQSPVIISSDAVCLFSIVLNNKKI